MVGKSSATAISNFYVIFNVSSIRYSRERIVRSNEFLALFPQLNLSSTRRRPFSPSMQQLLDTFIG
jgi:hypothetical protein